MRRTALPPARRDLEASLALGVRIMRLAASLPTLEHFERPELLARLETLTSGRRTLAGAPRQLINLLGQALRAIGMVVLLAFIYPPVLVVPLLALAPAFADHYVADLAARFDQRTAETLGARNAGNPDHPRNLAGPRAMGKS